MENPELNELFRQEHPAGCVDLSPNTTSFIDRFRRRAFDGGDLSEIFHHNSKFNKTYQRRSKLTKGALPDEMAAAEHDYHGRELVDLPEPDSLGGDLETVLGSRRSVRDYTSTGITKATLGTILQHSLGIVEHAEIDELTSTYRPYPSAGGLQPIEIYPVITNGVDIENGIYYYSSRNSGLRVIDRGDDVIDRVVDAFIESEAGSELVEQTPVTFVMTGVFGRIMAKYGTPGYRFALIESGHIVQNILLVAESIEMSGVPLGAFLDDKIDDVLGVDGVNESTVYAVAIGHPKEETDHS